MAVKLYNLARMVATTTGTGTMTLDSAVLGHLTFALAGVQDGDTVSYGISDGVNSEVGTGVYSTSGPTLSRSVIKSTNSDSAISLSGSAQVFITPLARDLFLPTPPQGRLTTSTGVPVMTSDVSGAATVYYAPYVGQYVPIYNGSFFVASDIGAELSQALSDTTKSPAAATTNSNYDLFVWIDAGTVRLSRGPAWSSDTSRGTGSGTSELQRINGLWTNKQAITNGPAANRGTYVGTIRTNGSSQIDWKLGGAASGGSAASLNIWNCYNRVSVGAAVTDNGTSYTYSSGTIRSARASTNNRISFLIGLVEDALSSVLTMRGDTVAVANAFIQWGIGYDRTNGFDSPTPFASAGSAGVVNRMCIPSTLALIPALGSHFIQMCEQSDGSNSNTINTTGNPSILSAQLRM